MLSWVVPAQVLQKLMRHPNISLTITNCANVDAAATQAILGRERNPSRNTQQNETPEEAKENPSSFDP